MNISRKSLTIAYVVCLLLIAMATMLLVSKGERLPIVILLLIIVPGTIGYIRLMKQDKTK